MILVAVGAVSVQDIAAELVATLLLMRMMKVLTIVYVTVVLVVVVLFVVVLIFQSGVDGGGYVGVMKGGHVSVDVGEGNDGSTKTTFVRGYQHLLDHGVFQLVVAEEREWIKNWAGTG